MTNGYRRIFYSTCSPHTTLLGGLNGVVWNERIINKHGENRKKDGNFVLKNWLKELLGRPRHVWEDDVTVGCNGFYINNVVKLWTGWRGETCSNDHQISRFYGIQMLTVIAKVFQLTLLISIASRFTFWDGMWKFSTPNRLVLGDQPVWRRSSVILLGEIGCDYLFHTVIYLGEGGASGALTPCDRLQMAAQRREKTIFEKQYFYCLFLTNFKLLNNVKGKSINDCNLWKFIISVRSGNCVYLLQVPTPSSATATIFNFTMNFHILCCGACVIK